jgi:hypothetical protein
MSTRLTHHRAPLLGMARAALDGWFLNRRVVRLAEEQTRTEFDAALESTQRELDVEIALTRELARRVEYGFKELCALRVRVTEQIQAQDDEAEFNEIVARSFHPSQGGES